MPDLLFGLSSYKRADGRLAKTRLVNMFSEQSPTSPTGVVLLPRPGLQALGYDLGPTRGLYRESGVLNGRLLSVANGILYRDDIIVGDVPGIDHVEWAYTVDGLFVLSSGVIYQVAPDGTYLGATAFPDTAPAQSIAAINSIVVAIRRRTGQVYFRLPGDTTWGALDFFSAERAPDEALAVRALADMIWVFGRTTIEPFIPTDDADVPFQRLAGASIARGIKDRDSVVQTDNTIYFIGNDNIAYRLDSVPTRISDHSIEERLSKSETAKSWTFTWDGHAFYIVKLETETVVYDISNGRWNDFEFIGHSVDFGIQTETGVFACGSKQWQMQRIPGDDGEDMVRLFTSIAPAKEPVFCAALQIVTSPGTSSVLVEDPAIIETRWSDDQGRTWSDWKPASMGEGGSYRHRVIYRRLGMIDAPGRVFEHRITSRVDLRVSGVEMNPATGGRARYA